jgi:hypothetical protein
MKLNPDFHKNEICLLPASNNEKEFESNLCFTKTANKESSCFFSPFKVKGAKEIIKNECTYMTEMEQNEGENEY